MSTLPSTISGAPWRGSTRRASGCWASVISSVPLSARHAPRPTPSMPTVKAGAATAVNTAKAQLGKPYVYGGAGPDSFDCSGLTMYAWRAGGVGLPHSAEMQYNSIAHISVSQLQPGDLVFFYTPIEHF